ncbi:MAG TPA: ABC transporter substrate-binding protein [Chloroflexota bacterium]|jgi:ABC-type transport system substrate-binding protein|nr:ABC transporter substrate-binding protein [Chloroflexota bacterium]
MTRDRIARQRLLALLTAAGMLVAACNSGGGVPPKPEAQPTAAISQPKVEFQPKADAPAKTEAQSKAEAPAQAPPAAANPRVNRLVMGIVPPALETNAIRDLTPTIIWQLKPMYEYLLMMDGATGKLVPGLATEWSQEGDGKTYRMKLRKGVQFHDGMGEFTAQDVVFTWKDVTDPAAQYSDAQVFRDMIKDIQIVNDYEVVFTLDQNAPFFLYWVSQGQGGFEIRSKKHADQIGSVPPMDQRPLAGTGPYQFKERAQAQYIRFERVPWSHWRVNPDFPEFEYRFQREPSTRAAALQAHEIQLTALPTDLQDQSEKQGMKVVRGSAAGPRIFLNLSCCFIKDVPTLSGQMFPDSPLLDVKVRKALQKAINLDELNKAFFAGKGQPMVQTHMHPNSPGWNPEWVTKFADEYGYDPAAAKALLAEAGYTTAKPLQTNLHLINLPQFPGTLDVVEAIGGYWRGAGVQLEMPQIDQGEITQRQRQMAFKNDFFISGTSSVEFIGASAYWTSVQPRNSGYEDPTLDGLFLKIRSETDEAKRTELWREFGDYAFVTHPSINLFWLPAEGVVDPQVVGEYVFPGSITGTWTHVEYIKTAK